VLGSQVVGVPFGRIVTGANPTLATAGMSFEAFKTAIAVLLGVDQVLLGDDDIWNAADLSGRFSIGKYDTGEDELAHKYLPIFGKTLVYMPDGQANPWYVETIPDRDAKNNYFDASIDDDILVLNAGASYLFNGV
jgi:hypothetical protein